MDSLVVVSEPFLPDFGKGYVMILKVYVCLYACSTIAPKLPDEPILMNEVSSQSIDSLLWSG